MMNTNNIFLLDEITKIIQLIQLMNSIKTLMDMEREFDCETDENLLLLLRDRYEMVGSLLSNNLCLWELLESNQ